MNYTFEQFEKAAREKGLLDQFSPEDLNLAKLNPDVGISLLNYKDDFRNAGSDDARALARLGANGLRSSFGNYSGGETGGSFYKQPLSPSDYDGSRTQDIDKTLNKVQDSSFAWDAETDPAFGAYKKQYTREGERATKEALGTAAAATGGIPSTYAVAAASQAGQYHASQLADKIPELRQQRFNEFMQEKSADLAILDALQQLDKTEYGRFGDDLNFDINREQTAFERDTYEKANEEAKLKERAKNLASLGDFSLYKQLGYSDADIELMKKGFAVDEPKKAAALYGIPYQSGRSYSSNQNDSPAEEGIDYDTILQDVSDLIKSGISVEDIKSSVDSEVESGTLDKTSQARYNRAIANLTRDSRRGKSKKK